MLKADEKGQTMLIWGLGNSLFFLLLCFRQVQVLWPWNEN